MTMDKETLVAELAAVQVRIEERRRQDVERTERLLKPLLRHADRLAAQIAALEVTDGQSDPNAN